MRYVFEGLLRRVAEAEVDSVCTTVMYSKIEICILVIGPVQNGLGTDRFCVFNVWIGPGLCHMEAAATFLLNQRNHYLRVFLIRGFYGDSVALPICV